MKKFKSIYIEITRVCNLRCHFCPSKDINEPIMMDYERFIKIIDEVSPFTNSIYLHVLGEPLLHPDVFKMIEYAKDKVFVNMTTNGHLINQYFTEIIKSNLHILNISLQSLSGYDEEYIIKYLDDIHQLIIKKPDHLCIHLRLWNDENEVKLNTLVKLYLDKHHLTSYKNVTFSSQDEFTWPNVNHQDNEHLSSCLGGKMQLAIFNNLDVCLCCLDYHHDTIIGNLKQNSLEDILQGEKYLKALLGFQNHQPYFPLCKKCTYRNRFK